MNEPGERERQPKEEPRHDERDQSGRKVAPPIEREHETQQGALEQDEKRKGERR